MTEQAGAQVPKAAGREGRRALVLLAVGITAALLVGLAGWIYEAHVLGRSDADTFQRVEAEVRAQVDAMVASLRTAAAKVASRPDLVQVSPEGSDPTSGLFALVNDALQSSAPGELAATVYGQTGIALAWGGRPSEIPRDRIGGPEAVFIARGPLGLRLFLVQPVLAAPDATTTERRRLGSVAVERVLSSPADGGTLSGGRFTLATSILPVRLRTRYEGAGGTTGPDAFLIRGPGEAPLLEVQIPAGDIAAVRARWHRGIVDAVLVVIALTVLLFVGPTLDRRGAVHAAPPYLWWTAAAVGLMVVARALFWLATPESWRTTRLFVSSSSLFATFDPLLRSPVDFLLTSLTLAAAVAVVAPAAPQIRLARRRSGIRLPVWVGLVLQGGAGVALAGLLVGHQLFLSAAVQSTTVDVLRFSLHPWNPARLALIVGLVFFEAANVWVCALLLIGALAMASPARLARGGFVALWLLPMAGLLAWGAGRHWPVPILAVVLAGVVASLIALCARRATAWFRHATQAARLVTLFTAILVPGLLLYPAVLFHTDQAKRALIEHDFAVQPARHPQELQAQLARALDQIDAIPGLADLVSAAPAPVSGSPPTDSAFTIWSETVLAESRLTSAIELYGPSGALVSRFALNLPEYTALAQNYKATKCTWEPFGEAAPFGSEERRMLHAERALCDPADPTRPSRGTIVVHVMLDYRALPFLSWQGPYQQLLRTSAPLPDEVTRGGDVELVIYGWGLLPIYTSGSGAWLIDDALFARIYASRQPFWTEMTQGDVSYHVYVSNDRNGIYALGYPAMTPVDHLERLAEISTFCGAVYVVLMAGAAVFRRLGRGRPRQGRVLLREILASFYRKLFLAFVLASAGPVVTLAIVVQAYFAAKLHMDAATEAARTAAVAQRVIEEFAALQQRGGGVIVPLTDDLMVLISQLIDQDVNIFEGPRLIATSERDLFASGLLPQRTPAEIFRAVRLERQPSYVGEDALGPVRYLIAAAPVRAAGHDAILTVPLALRQREIEREIDDLNRGIHLAALLFILLGAGIGLWMAERIANPVGRLTRATRRIARGDYDARILVRSSDELQRLVDAFNTMAGNLKAQAARLERTSRLEAWAEMARQVAHEIKNPLTPIQLSAEHLRRVHADRGEPLSPVLESCVDSILRQVTLLRQIAAEFSAFASSPVPQPAPTAIAELLAEVVEAYRTGLAGRIRIDVDAPAELPLALVDRTLIARAIVNVVENALHAMPGTGVLALVARAEDGRLRLDLTDTGVGMDPQALSRVFEPYFSTRTSGTGLGLTIAKRNVESNGGTIAVASERGRGTTVTIWLPTAPSAGPP